MKHHYLLLVQKRDTRELFVSLYSSQESAINMLNYFYKINFGNGRIIEVDSNTSVLYSLGYNLPLE